ncbi:hypothetical protein [Rhizobium sp. 18065]|uniref:hypothetical protein n=1 Tax=Rhizobium sp. 18065 TaxID=2681411 RepID=UPI00135CBD2A|nr:hypothetical protein [Rhizobium sp. 18065]
MLQRVIRVGRLIFLFCFVLAGGFSLAGIIGPRTAWAIVATVWAAIATLVACILLWEKEEGSFIRLFDGDDE